MPSKRKFYRTVIQVEVLSEDPITTEFDNDCLRQIAREISVGDCSGKIEVIKQEKVDGPRMVELLEAQGSDPEFFRITEDGEDVD